MLLDLGADIAPEVNVGDLKMTPIHIAAAMNFHRIIRVLKGKGININIQTQGGFTALHFAAIKNSLLSMRLLISLGAQPYIPDENGRIPLYHAARNGHIEAVRYLLGIELMVSKFPNAKGILPAKCAVSVEGAIDLQPSLDERITVNDSRRDKDIALRISAENGHAEVATLLLAEGANPRSTSEFGSSPLHLAAYNGHARLVELLLEAGADATALEKNKNTVLHLAAHRGQIEFVQKLLTVVPKLDINPRNRWDKTPLHCAAENGHSEIAQLLLQRRAIVSTDVNQNLPIHLAAASGYEVVVSQFLERDINVPGFFGRTALWNAAYHGHVKVVQLLLGIHGVDINASDDDSCSPMLMSLFSGHLEISRLLIDKGAGSDKPSKFGHTPLHAAANTGNEEFSKKLLDRGCNGLAISYDGRTPFLLAVLCDNIKIVDMLFEKGYDGSKIPDQRGYTCIHAAAENGNLEMLEKLRALGIEPLAHTVPGFNAVYFAACKGQLETINWIIDWLQELKADFEDSEKNPESSLCGAASYGYFAVVQRLIELGVDVEKLSNYAGMSPLMFATAYCLPKTVEQLVLANADPFRRNAYGLSAMDYASRHPPTSHQLIQFQVRYQPIDLALRKDHLQKTIQDSLQSILALPRLPMHKGEYNRNVLVLTLGYSLVYINETSHDEAKLCFVELFFFSNPPPMFYLDADCFTCNKKIICEDYYVCTQCLHVILCKSCQSKYSIGGAAPNSAPKGFEVMQKMENEILEVRKVVKRVLDFGAEPIAMSYTYIGVLKNWLKERIEAYESWETNYNSGGDFKNYKRPGQEFLRLIGEVRNLIIDLEGHHLPATERKSRFAPLDRKIAVFFKKYNVDKDSRDFICSGHPYLHISKNEWEHIKSTGKVFDSQDKLKTEWLLMLLDKYQIEGDKTNTNNEKIMPHKRSTTQIEDHKEAKHHSDTSKAEFAPSDSSIKRTSKPQHARQDSRAATCDLAETAFLINKLQVHSHEMTAEAPVSIDLQTSAVTSSMEKSRSQDYSRPETRAHDNDGGGGGGDGDSNSSYINNKNTTTSIAKEILAVFHSLNSLDGVEVEAEMAASRLPVLEATLELAEMIQLGSSEEFLYNYREKLARQERHVASQREREQARRDR